MEKLLIYSPGFAKDLLFTIWGIRAKSKRYGKYYKESIKFLRESEKWNREKLFEYQKEMLRKLFVEAFKCSEYYHAIFKKMGISILDIKKDNPFNILSTFPILEKDFLRNNLDLISNKCRKTFVHSKTSGTTGSPLLIPFDKKSWQFGFALQRRIYDWAGLPENFKVARFTGHFFISKYDLHLKRYWVTDYANGRLFMSTYHLNEKTIQYYVEKLNKFRPNLVEGYPSSIYILAKLIKRNKLKLNFDLYAVITTAETLLDIYRDTIEEVFNTKVIDQYASSEGAPVIAQCRYGKMHMFVESGIIEFLDLKKKDEDNIIDRKTVAKEGVVTSFANWKVPLIRYRIGDTFLVEDIKTFKKCKCGVDMPYVIKILGRINDIVYTPDRGYISIATELIFKHLYGKNIKSAQIIQKTPKDFVFKIVPEANFSELDIKSIIKKSKQVLGNVNVKIDLVNHIPIYGAGKYRAVIREFDI